MHDQRILAAGLRRKDAISQAKSILKTAYYCHPYIDRDDDWFHVPDTPDGILVWSTDVFAVEREDIPWRWRIVAWSNPSRERLKDETLAHFGGKVQ